MFWECLREARPAPAEDSLATLIRDAQSLARPRARKHRQENPVELELMELCRIRRMTDDGEVQKLASKMIWRFRRAQKRLRFQRESRTAVHRGRTGPCSKKEVNRAHNHAVVLQDQRGEWHPRSHWPRLIADFFSTLFASDEGALPQEVWGIHEDAREVEPLEVYAAL